jgi:leucyl-tRNA synthetase
MEGKNVLYPIGWDAFGLPTENFAIKHKVKPAVATKKNVANFTRQLKSLGFGFDWSREIDTTDPAYYKWTQWMFLKFFNSYYDETTKRARPLSELKIPPKARLQGPKAIAEYLDEKRMAYKASATINWCPACKIGLANEEAQGGVCERCGGKVEKREKAQWMIRITAYADRLIEDLKTVDYLDRIRTQQINWIGRSEGASVDFPFVIDNLSFPSLRAPEGARQSNRRKQSLILDCHVVATPRNDSEGVISVFTTRPDTLFGATYLVLSPEYPLLDRWLQDGVIKNARNVQEYREGARKKSDIERQENKEKTGVVLDGILAVNPATGENIPVWIADYVLSGYGTGAIMAVPAHDERDWEFAKKHGLPINHVVAPHVVDPKNPPQKNKKTVPRRTVHAIVHDSKTDRYLCLKWKKHPWTTFVLGGVEHGEDPIKAAIREVREETGYVNIKLRHVLDAPIMSEYFAAHKDENRLAEATAVIFDLVTDEREDVTSEETAKHESIWLTRKELATEEFTCSELPFWLPHFEKSTMSVYDGQGVLIHSGFLNGLDITEAKEKMIAWLEKEKKGKRTVNFKLRDWVFSRQRYWGEPIPIIFCDECGPVAVAEKSLPVKLPDVRRYEPTDTGESPLAKISTWVKVKCPSCNRPAKRETDTMPNWAGSSWYFLRYCDPHNRKEFASAKSLKYWMPVDLYNGGMEHTTLHLLYSRFWYKFLWDLRLIPEECGSEPYARRRSHALILGEGGVKMSKSKGNVVNPDDVVAVYGADVFRLYEMFIGPFDADAPWDTRGIEGVKRFIEKVWRMFERVESQKSIKSIKSTDETLLHQTIKKVGEDIESLNFNTAISAMMILVNELSGVGAGSSRPGAETGEGVGTPPLQVRETFLKLLAPFAPHVAEELWQKLGHKTSIHVSEWPSYDETKLVADTFELVVQVNGKVRDRMTVPSDISEKDATEAALASPKIKVALDGKEPKKVIYVMGRLVSIVI